MTVKEARPFSGGGNFPQETLDLRPIVEKFESNSKANIWYAPMTSEEHRQQMSYIN
jgi:hypothetical protein